ncbi:MAG: DUF934 domain-containing protein [Pseudomonadota bacterium]|nr:DUF934 domain-containing protein [Pseudomonadota bacterium]
MEFIDPHGSLPTGVLLLDNHTDVVEHKAAVLAAGSVALHFPKWTDGRAYSQAVLLRGRVRFTGRIIAIGDVLADMLPLLQRCGFDAVQMRADQKLETAQRSLGLFPAHYQVSASERHAVAASVVR